QIVKVKVTQPKLHGCNTKKFVDYEITIETNNKAFFRKFSSVRRRYSDFCWLRAKLCSTEINGFGMNRTVPDLPPKNYFGRFSKEVVDARQQGLQDFLIEIVKVDDFLSFAGLHLFLQTQLPVQEIDGFLDGKYGEHASVEELIDTHELTNASEDNVEYVCSSEKCALMSANWDIPSPAISITTCESDDVSSAKSLSCSYNSSDSLLGPMSSSVESSSFMYTVYR
ncbi:unnamed protein product, partial [Porites evermanni]